MSLNKSATRRLSLLAGSSLVAAGLTVAVSAGALLAPAAALAQATCTAATAVTGNGTNAVTIAAGTNNPGITCNYVGDFATVTTGGTITVSSTSGVPGDPLVNGVNLRATGTDDITWISTAGTLSGGAQTNGPVIDARTASGNITLNTVAIGGSGSTVSHGVFAEATGAGNINFTTTSNVNLFATNGNAAVEMNSGGGNINISASAITGRRYGVRAQTTGAGRVTLTTSSFLIVDDSGIGIAVIDVSAGTGGVGITLGGNVSAGPAGLAIRLSSAGAAVINQNRGYLNGRVDFSGVTAGGVTLNVAPTGGDGRWTASGASVFSALNDTVTIASSDFSFFAGIDISTFATGASIDMAAGNDTLSVSGRLETAAATVTFGAGADTLSASGRLFTAGTTLAFGDGADTFGVSGVYATDGATVTGLESFNNSGLILMGAGRAADLVVDFLTTDNGANDMLALPGATFTGSGSSRIVMDVLLEPGSVQAGCATPTGAADCLDLRTGSTAGSTLLTVNNIGADASQGGYSPVGITLVDVGGAGTSAASHFTLDPNSEGYIVDPLLGGAIERPGLFRYILQYDAANQRHVLVGLPRSEALEYAMLSSAAQATWHMTAEAVTDRQSDLRAGGEGSIWMRARGEATQRDMETTFESYGRSFAIDNGYKLYAGTIMGGWDLLSGKAGGLDYVAGVQLGYVSSSFDLNQSASSGRFSGAAGGVYASLWNEQFFLDTTVNLNGLALDYDAPVLGTKTNTYLNSLGGRAEMGFRAKLSERTFAEPLVTLTYVNTSFEEISLVGGEIEPQDAVSTRGAVGLRLGATLSGETVSASYFITGRAWSELDGEGGGQVHNPGLDLPFADAFSGAFGQAEIGANVFNSANTLSAFVSSGVKFKDDYSAVSLALGVRMAW